MKNLTEQLRYLLVPIYLHVCALAYTTQKFCVHRCEGWVSTLSRISGVETVQQPKGEN